MIFGSLEHPIDRIQINFDETKIDDLSTPQCAIRHFLHAMFFQRIVFR